MSRIFRDQQGNKVQPGEVWYDHAGNECSYRENGTLRVTTINNEPTMTIQSERDNCDLNVIVNRYLKTGVMSNLRTDQPIYGDFSHVNDYQSAMIAVREANEQFMELPALIRKRFNNDPHELLLFMGNPNNRSEAIELGLVPKPQADQMPQGDGTPPVVTPAAGG